MTSALRIAALLYAAVAFVGTFAFFAYFILFLANAPKRSAPWLEPTIDVGSENGLASALLINTCLVSLFALQHSGMARRSFKQWLARRLPEAVERATYVHAANATAFLIVFVWQPIPIVVWHVTNDALETILWVGFALGWVILLAAAVSFDVSELLGLRQVLSWLNDRPPSARALKTTWLYAKLNHPMYVGLLLGVWSTPYMTVGHALLAALFTAYIALASRWEKRDLRARFGNDYDAWRSGCPLTPRGSSRSTQTDATSPLA